MKRKRVWKVLFCALLLLMARFTYAAVFNEHIDKATFYAAMTSGSLADINKELAVLSDNDQGYIGAMLIRKAGAVARPAEKLKLFKAGRIKLETALLNDPENTELHFLRLSIQERAPKIVKYKSNLEADKAFVIKHFSELPLIVQHAVKEYTKNSKILKPSDFSTDRS